MKSLVKPADFGPMPDRVVFFMGAGFSAGSGAPVQSRLLNLALNTMGSAYSSSSRFPLHLFAQDVKEFLKQAFQLSEHQFNPDAGPDFFNLEDFYTPIDRCIQENVSFRGYGPNYLRQIRYQMDVLIAFAVDNALVAGSKEEQWIVGEWVQQLERWTQEVRKEVKPKFATLLSTNWDDLVEFSQREFYGTGWDQDETPYPIDFGTRLINYHFPELELGARSNLKLLKLHGSINWLKCSNCNRLYSDKKMLIGVVEGGNGCKYCQSKTKYVEYRDPYGHQYHMNEPMLEAQLKMPTFLKDLSNPHFKSIWQEAAIQLSQAQRIVFMGYSLPQADFEIRQLLARYVPDECEIEVVLREKDEIEPAPVSPGYWATPYPRYRSFFGKRADANVGKLRFDCRGVRSYLEDQIRQLQPTAPATAPTPTQLPLKRKTRSSAKHD